MPDFFELLKTIFLGIVQGITEWLPISSTGHMILVNELIQLNVSKEFWDMFLVVIQLGSILAVIFLYFTKLNPFAPSKSVEEKKDTWTLWFKVLVGIIPAGVVGVLCNDWIETHLNQPYVVAAALIVYGVLFIVIENRNKSRVPKIDSFNTMSYKNAFMIGMFQVLSLLPGTSRSGSTILGAVLLGTSREIAAEYSFFMAIPVMFGASALKLLKFGFNFTPDQIVILVVGFVVAFVVSYFVIKFLLHYIRRNDFKAFGYYRIVLGVLVILYGMIVGFSSLELI